MQTVHAPALNANNLPWFNAHKPLDLPDLKGKVAILDFWTFCCINCIHIIPTLKKLESRFPKSLAVIGVHSPKFPGEKNVDNVQKDYEWINDILKGYQQQHEDVDQHKESVYRSDLGSESYVPILEELGLKNIQVSGVYPLPMISHSIDFPFSLMPADSEKSLVNYFEQRLKENGVKTGKHPWLCKEGFGNAFLIWGVK